MIIFIYGEDSYRSRQKLKEIIEEYKNPAFGENLDSYGIKKVRKSGLNLKFFDCQEKKTLDIFGELNEQIRQTSMFKEKKLIVVFGPFTSGGFKEQFSKKIKNLKDSDDVILLYEEREISKSDSFFKILQKNAKCQEFELLSGLKLKNWVKKEIERYKAKIEPTAMEKLIVNVGNDLWQMANEVKKLVSFRNGKKIKTEDINLLVRPKIENDIFKTIDAIAQKNKKQALGLLQKHLEDGDHPLYLLSMINYQIRNLLIVKDFIEKHKPYDYILKKSGLHPFVVRKTYSQCRQFDLKELKKIYQKIFDADLKIKTGQIEPETALELLIAGIL